jgi:hypothetical protein
MRHVTKLIGAAALLGFAPALFAQTAQQSRTSTTLLNTPIGALPPLYSSAGTGSISSGQGLALRYGRGGFGIDNLGITADLGARFSDHTSITLGMRQCPGCEQLWMAGVDFYAQLVRSPLSSDASVFSVGLQPNVGAAHSFGAAPWYWSASMGLPIAVETNVGSHIRVAPFVSPGIGYGMISAGSDRVNGSIVPMLGGGVGLFTSSGLGLHVGGNRVIAENNGTQWGIGLSWRGTQR